MADARIAWVRPSKLLWLLPVAIIAGGALMFGTPHMLWSFSYQESGGARFYLSCDYVGRHPQRVHPTDGLCPLILFLKT